MQSLIKFKSFNCETTTYSGFPAARGLITENETLIQYLTFVPFRCCELVCQAEENKWLLPVAGFQEIHFPPSVQTRAASSSCVSVNKLSINHYLIIVFF